jgi:hypothetical protein
VPHSRHRKLKNGRIRKTKMAYLRNPVIPALAALLMVSATQGHADGNQTEALDSLPFHRVIDLQVGIGIPDGLHGAIELHPTNTIHLEASAGSLAGLILSRAANIKYRPNMSLRPVSNGRIRQVQLGPGVGVRYEYLIDPFLVILYGLLEDSDDAPTFEGWFADVMVSLEYTVWFARHFGLTIQLDAGVSLYTGAGNMSPSPGAVSPMFRLNGGLGF